ncbi:hypothetical protein EII19_00230 [Comamonadaceae bacterium OH2310_COT-174]|nr:hypothetical protein EII19_00230 [Comamonadaceae bacterium OH2310_COT-174]
MQLTGHSNQKSISTHQNQSTPIRLGNDSMANTNNVKIIRAMLFLAFTTAHAAESALPECSPDNSIGFKGPPRSSPSFSWNQEIIPEVFFHDHSKLSNRNPKAIDEASDIFHIKNSSNIKHIAISPSKNMTKIVIGHEGIDYHYIVIKHSTQDLSACTPRDRINFAIHALPTILSFAESDSTPKKCMISSMSFDLKSSLTHQFSSNVDCQHPLTKESAKAYAKSIEDLMDSLYR